MSAVPFSDIADRIAPIIAARVAEQVLTLLRAHGIGTQPPAQPAPVSWGSLGRLSIDEFAFVIDRCPAVVSRKIRGRVIPKHLVHGPPYKIHPKALELFAVTPDIAAARMAEWRAKQAPTVPEASPPSP